MSDHFEEEDYYQEDPLAVGRGITFGLLFGSLIWAAIIGLFLYFFKLN